MTRIEEIKKRMSGYTQSTGIKRVEAWELLQSYCEDDIQYLLSKLEIAIQALEEYTEDEQHCARCDGMTYDTGNGKVAREALQQIRS